MTALLAHPAACVQPGGRLVPGAYLGGLAEVIRRHSMAPLDEPDHTRVRRSIAIPLGRVATESLRDVVSTLVDRAVVERQSFDAVADFVVSVPRAVVRCRPHLQFLSIEYLVVEIDPVSNGDARPPTDHGGCP